MTKIYLLKFFKSHDIGEIITVSNDIALDLINQKIARECQNRDFLVKSELGVSKAFDTFKLHKGRRVVKK